MSFACCRMFVVRMYPLDAVPTDSTDGAVLPSRLPYFGNPHSRRRSRSRRERFAVLYAGVGRTTTYGVRAIVRSAGAVLY